MEKNVKVSILLEIYGELLTKTQYQFLDDYYNSDLSLSEIAENKNIKMRYLKPSKASKNAKFLYRSVDLVDEADLVICFKGTWGTLSELVFAVMCSKKILFLNIDGDNETLKEIYNLMQKINLYNWHESFIEVNSISKLKEELEKFKSENK